MLIFIINFFVCIFLLDDCDSRSVSIFISSKFKNDTPVTHNTDTWEHTKDEERSKRFQIPILLMINDKVPDSNDSAQQNAHKFVSNENSLEKYEEEGGLNSVGDMENREEVLERVIIDKNGYLGCYFDSDQPIRDLPIRLGLDHIVPELCRIECGKIKMRYASVQYGYLCFCGQRYGRHGEAPEIFCQTPCMGNRSLACGGMWKNSVYDTIGNNNDSIRTKTTITQIPNNRSQPEYQNEIEINQDKSSVNLEKARDRTQVVTTEFGDKQNVSDIRADNNTSLNESNKTQSLEEYLSSLNTKVKISDSENDEEFANIFDRFDSKYFNSEFDSYIFVVLKQSWSSELSKENSTSYKILHGNILSAVKKEFENCTSVLGVKVLQMIPQELRTKGLLNSATRVGVLIGMSTKGTVANNEIDQVIENISKSEKIGGILVFPSTMKMKDKQGKAVNHSSSIEVNETTEIKRTKKSTQTLRGILSSLKKYAFTDGD